MTAATETTNIAAHGGTLINRVVPPEQRKEARERAAKLRAVRIDARAASELLLIATGAFSPLTGFQTKAAAQSVADKMSLLDGTLWPLPILLQLSAADAEGVRVGERVALTEELPPGVGGHTGSLAHGGRVGPKGGQGHD